MSITTANVITSKTKLNDQSSLCVGLYFIYLCMYVCTYVYNICIYIPCYSRREDFTVGIANRTGLYIFVLLSFWATEGLCAFKTNHFTHTLTSPSPGLFSSYFDVSPGLVFLYSDDSLPRPSSPFPGLRLPPWPFLLILWRLSGPFSSYSDVSLPGPKHCLFVHLLHPVTNSVLDLHFGLSETEAKCECQIILFLFLFWHYES